MFSYLLLQLHTYRPTHAHTHACACTHTHKHEETYSCPLLPQLFEFRRTSCSSSLFFGLILPPSSPFFSKPHPPGPSLPCPHKPPLHHLPLRLLTVPQRESAALMDATDGPFPWSSQPWRSVCSAGSEARPPHEMHVVTGNKRRAPIPTNSHSTPSSPPLPSLKKNGGGMERAGEGEREWGVLEG